MDKSIKVWNLENMEIKSTLYGHTESVRSVAITINDEFIISGSEDKSIRIWDFRNKQQLAVLENSSIINSIAVTRNNKYFILVDKIVH